MSKFTRVWGKLEHLTKTPEPAPDWFTLWGDKTGCECCDLVYQIQRDALKFLPIKEDEKQLVMTKNFLDIRHKKEKRALLYRDHCEECRALHETQAKETNGL